MDKHVSPKNELNWSRAFNYALGIYHARFGEPETGTQDVDHADAFARWFIIQPYSNISKAYDKWLLHVARKLAEG